MPIELYVNDWLVQVELNLVSRSGRTVRIEPKAMQVLALLAAHQNELVLKQTLKSHVWAGTFVSDDVLIRCISELRKILENDPRAPSLIQTVNRGGYRLAARVASAAEAEIEKGESREATGAEPGRKVSRTGRIAGAASLGLLLFVLTLALWPSSSEVRGLAVLPFRNLSGDPRHDHLADAITDLVTAELAESRDFDVASTTSVRRYEGTALPIATISTELDVDALVEGSIMATGARMTISAHLIDTQTNHHLWSGIYEWEGSYPADKEAASRVAREIRKALGR